MKGKGPGRNAAVRAWRRAAAARLGGPVRFVQALARRHAWAARGLPALELPLAAPGTWQLQVVHNRAGDRVTHWDVRVQALMQRVQGTQLRIQHASQPAGAPPMTLAGPDRAASQPARAAAARSGEAAWMPRLVARGTRVDRVLPAGSRGLPSGPARMELPAPAAARAGDPAAPDFPAVRPRPAPAAPEGGPRLRGEQEQDPAAAPRRVSATVAPALPAQEIARITEQVMDSIDRRILAERERRGRF